MKTFPALSLVAVIAMIFMSYCSAFTLRAPSFVMQRYSHRLNDIPLELEGQLDASRSWDVKFIFNGEEKIVSVSEDTSMLEKGETIFDGVDSSCRNGVCTTCAGKVNHLSSVATIVKYLTLLTDFILYSMYVRS